MLVGGAIASGKTTVTHAAAAALRRGGIQTGVVDVDVVYEMLEQRGSSPGKPAVWSRARGVAGRIAAELLDAGAAVVLVESGFLDPGERAEIGLDGDLVVLRVSIGEALRRVRADASRGISKDESFLRRHYDDVAARFAELPSSALVLDTEALGPAEVGHAIAALATTTCRRGPAA